MSYFNNETISDVYKQQERVLLKLQYEVWTLKSDDRIKALDALSHMQEALHELLDCCTTKDDES